MAGAVLAHTRNADMPRISLNPEARNMAHRYDVGASKDGIIVLLDIRAQNRDHAARIAERAGYTVRDVNMVG